MVGNYLTSAGGTPEQVVGMVEGEGLRLRPPPDRERWAFRGAAPSDTRWNERAAGGERRRSLPVLG